MNEDFAVLAGLREVDHMGRLGRSMHMAEMRDGVLSSLVEQSFSRDPWSAPLPGLDESIVSDGLLTESSMNQEYESLRRIAQRDPEIAAVLMKMQNNQEVSKKDAYENLKKLMFGGLAAGVGASAAVSTGAWGALKTGILTGGLGLLGVAGAASMYMAWKWFKQRLDKYSDLNKDDPRAVDADATEILRSAAREIARARTSLSKRFTDEELKTAETDKGMAKKVLSFARQKA